jgi:hypothetical protein
MNKKMMKALLASGVVVGPLYMIVGLAQAFTRAGFDITRHPLSILSNGDLGWIQVINFLVSGILVIGAAVGLRQALRGGRGGTWAPILIGIYGLGIICGGIFKADPAMGFPPGTPETVETISTSGMLHFMLGGIGFLGLISACIVMSRRFAASGNRGLQVFSLFTGIYFLVSFFSLAMGSMAGDSVLAVVTLAFYAAVMLAWAWLSTICYRFWIENI